MVIPRNDLDVWTCLILAEVKTGLQSDGDVKVCHRQRDGSASSVKDTKCISAHWSTAISHVHIGDSGQLRLMEGHLVGNCPFQFNHFSYLLPLNCSLLQLHDLVCYVGGEIK